jgi:hypothetical protein
LNIWLLLVAVVEEPAGVVLEGIEQLMDSVLLHQQIML